MASYSMCRDFFDTEQKQHAVQLNKEVMEFSNRELKNYYYTMLDVYPNLIHPIIQIQSKKRYISAAFWNYTSTPINFVITLFTGLTAGQAGSNSSYLSGNTVFIMLFVCFILSTINIFFKLKEKAELNFISAKKYEGFNSDIENIDMMPTVTTEDMKKKLEEYKRVKREIDDFNKLEKIENVNYFTEFLYFIVQKYKSHRKLKLLYKHAAIKDSKVYQEKNKILKELVLNGVITQSDLDIIDANLEEIQANIDKIDRYGLLSSFFKSDVKNINKNPEDENIDKINPYYSTPPPVTQRPDVYYPSFKKGSDYSNESYCTLDNNSTVDSYYNDTENVVLQLKDVKNDIYDDCENGYDSLLDEKYGSVGEKENDFNRVQIIRKKQVYFDNNNDNNFNNVRK
jgi:hypothetical protein